MTIQVLMALFMGFGGYFMHSRVGLKTGYLGDNWSEGYAVYPAALLEDPVFVRRTQT